LNTIIDDIIISNFFLNYRNKFKKVNDAIINAFRWKANKLSDFSIKSNSKYIIKSLRWFINMLISIKDKDDKTVIVIENFAYINNGESKPMLCLGMI